MKKLLFLLPIGLFISACSNDFEVTAPWKEIPIVYGILSPNDTAHYIRIEKAFIDPDKSALDIAQIADSLYYPESAITVWLESTDLLPNTRLQLHRVDGALEGHPRDPGIFAQEPNWLYKVKPAGNLALLPGKTYRLRIERNDSNKPDITAETTLPKAFTILYPRMADQVPKVVFAGGKDTNIRWSTDENGVFFNVIFVVRYNERNLNGSLIGTYQLVWEAAKNIQRGTDGSGGVYQASVPLSGNSFYRFLAQHLQKPAANRYREFESCDVIVDGGGKEIQAYLSAANANAGLTGAETFPNYTNISEGFGIFTAKNRTIGNNVRIDVITVDSMNRSPIADTLGFVH